MKTVILCKRISSNLSTYIKDCFIIFQKKEPQAGLLFGLFWVLLAFYWLLLSLLLVSFVIARERGMFGIIVSVLCYMSSNSGVITVGDIVDSPMVKKMGDIQALYAYS